VSPAEEKLEKYREMRDFEASPEPSGDEAAPTPDGERPRFVVQEHHATALHWDLRLERDGVLVSWAVPKGVPPDPRENHLAVHTEDHPLMYLDFHGEIPEGSYGAGTMEVWDTGTYEPVKWTDREVVAVFHGKKVQGRYALFQTRGKQWMIHRMDPPADPGRELMPHGLRPMLATDGELPEDEEGWGFEVDWDGVRAVLASDGGRVEINGAEGEVLLPTAPEMRSLGLALGSLPVVLDGELIAFGDDGRPDPERLRRRLEAKSDASARRLAAATPLTYVIYDLLWIEGHSVMDRAYEERRSRLDELELAGPHWQTPAWHRGDGAALLQATTAQGLAGVVAKRLGSPYRPGEVTTDWIRVRARA
jgi:bifunctional non-homologous end joining protein LigD